MKLLFQVFVSVFFLNSQVLATDYSSFAVEDCQKIVANGFKSIENILNGRNVLSFSLLNGKSDPKEQTYNYNLNTYCDSEELSQHKHLIPLEMRVDSEKMTCSIWVPDFIQGCGPNDDQLVEEVPVS